MNPIAGLALSGCLAVGSSSDHVTAGDLAAAIPVFAALPPDTPLAPAPAPGVVRVFAEPELQRLGRRLRLPEGPYAKVCVDRPVSPPDPGRFLAAMRNTLPEAKIKIVDYSRHPIPEGQIEFPARGLQAGADGALWMGFVRFGGDRKFTIWARVEALVTARRVLAAEDLRPGRPISAAQVVAQSRDEFPARQAFAETLADVVGKWPRAPIRARSVIRMDQIERAKEVLRGDAVKVEFQNGGIRMELNAIAEESGAPGQSIPVRNTASNKRFFARVEAKGRVSVGASAGR